MADSFGLKIGLEGEKEFKKALADINQSFKVLGSEMKLATSQFDKNDKSVEALAARNKVLRKEIDEQTTKIETLRKALQNVKQGEKLYLSAELEALSKAEQREAMESDEREGLVRLYLDTLLPEGWDGMDIFERRNFLTGSDFGDTQKHGTVKRTQVSNMEIWCECFGKERANIRRTDSNELTAILARLGWKRLDSKVRIPLYGPQYVFVPKECS